MIPKGSKKTIVVKTEPVTAKKNQKNGPNNSETAGAVNDSETLGVDYENENDNDDGAMMVTLDGEGEGEEEYDDGGGGHMDDDGGDD